MSDFMTLRELSLVAYAKGRVRVGSGGMESNVQCAIHSINITTKVSKVCLWNSMLHSPISAANVTIVGSCFTNVWSYYEHLTLPECQPG